MRTFEEVLAASRDERPFANGTEGYGWMDAWCWGGCVNDRNEDCPLIAVAMCHQRTPSEWLDQKQIDPAGLLRPYSIADQYHCIEYRGEGDDGREPEPIPDPPGQGILLAREPFEQTRMLTPYEPIHTVETIGGLL